MSELPPPDSSNNNFNSPILKNKTPWRILLGIIFLAVLTPLITYTNCGKVDDDKILNDPVNLSEEGLDKNIKQKVFIDIAGEHIDELKSVDSKTENSEDPNFIDERTITTSSGGTCKAWVQEAYIKKPYNLNSDFGMNAGVLSMSGTGLALGVPGVGNTYYGTNDPSGDQWFINVPSSDYGKAYVFRRSGSTWTQEATIGASNADFGDMFGTDVSLSGTKLAVGAPGESSNQSTITNGIGSSSINNPYSVSSGAAYIYQKNGSNWIQEAYVKASNADGMDWFGSSVSLSGVTLAVGAKFEDSNQTTVTNGTGSSSNDTKTSSGATYIYRKNSGVWAQEAYIKASNADLWDVFGSKVFIAGSRLVVTAPCEQSNQTTVTNGSTASSNNFYPVSCEDGGGAGYVFEKVGGQWTQVAYLKVQGFGSFHQGFGDALSISGNNIAIAAPRENGSQTWITNGSVNGSNTNSPSAGAVYLFAKVSGIWTHKAYIKPSNSNSQDYFGSSISLLGNQLVVGAPNEDSNQLIITNGSTASADNSRSNSGAAYVFSYISNAWAQTAYLKATNADVDDRFGSSVAVSGDRIAVLAPFEDSNVTTIMNGSTASSNNSVANSGAIYVFYCKEWIPSVIVIDPNGPGLGTSPGPTTNPTPTIK